MKGDTQNKFAIGSVIELFSGNEILRQELIPNRGFQSSVDMALTFGIGTKKIDSARVIWPNGKYQIIKDLKPNKTVNLDMVTSNLAYKSKTKIEKKLFAEVANNFTTHQENDYIDFDYEGLISKMISREGPAMAVADINNDGNDDVFIGGAKGQAGSIYINKGNNNYTATSQMVFSADADFEDTAAQFFDTDNDGDLDLFVGSGGNNNADKANYKNRLYLNNGKGIFTESTTSIPTTNNNVSAIAAYDFDNDGDTDVFVASRSVPGVYGIVPKQLLLENDGKGSFTNITDKKAFKLNEVGMITDAVWEDIDNDGKKDLIVVGDWMAPQIFKNTGRRLASFKSNLSNYSGFWNTLQCVDLNNDGKKDLVLGNRGTNSSYKATAKNPMKLFVNDFDNNGTIEQIMTRNFDGRDLPVHMKQELAKQIPSIKKKNLSYEAYSKKTIQEIFDPALISNAIQRTANIQESVVAMNTGGGNFKVQILPNQVQFSTVNAICVLDVNKDGILDLVLGGNQYDFKTQYGRLDSNFGSVLLGNKKGTFAWVPYQQSGFEIKGQIKNCKVAKSKNNKITLIVGINNGKPKIFKQND